MTNLWGSVSLSLIWTPANVDPVEDRCVPVHRHADGRSDAGAILISDAFRTGDAERAVRYALDLEHIIVPGASPDANRGAVGVEVQAVVALMVPWRA
jgi:hypothetical protein